jgi:hypothetical protein
MANSFEIRKTVLDKTKYDLLVDRTIKTFVPPVEESSEAQIESLFKLYDELYTEIPIEGEVNSHEYLVKRSSELVKLESTLGDIQPLLDEIAQLREQLLQANIRILDLENSSVQK